MTRKFLHRNVQRKIVTDIKVTDSVRSLCDALVRPVLRTTHRLVRLFLIARRPTVFSAHAFAFTRQNRLVLVKLRYAGGWRLPGGGRSSQESARQAVLRELREEIGLEDHGGVEIVGEEEDDSDGRCDRATLLIVRDVEYQAPRWSWEVERVTEAFAHQLPPDISPTTARLLRTYLSPSCVGA